MHIIEIDHLVLEPEEGLILGNGDLSVSIYQKSGQIIWRLGKNDIWDQRLDLSDSPKPAHIDEISHGIRDEGWVSRSYLYGRGEATRGTDNPQRMKELCDGFPAYSQRPYPCPKPLGELAVNLPIDQKGLRVSQQLFIEENNAEVECRWEGGATIRFNCFIPPSPNALVVSWNVENWTDDNIMDGQSPISFCLYRWSDPTVEEFVSRRFTQFRRIFFAGSLDAGKATPLPTPVVSNLGGHNVIKQKFWDDLRYMLAPFTADLKVEPVEIYDNSEARLHIGSNEAVLEGCLVVAVPTSSDEGGVEGEFDRVSRMLANDPKITIQQWRQNTEVSARKFWNQSAVEIEDPVLENTWYETLHIRRCAYREDTVAPGLALPSTLEDYSFWHGDYHTNYNYQSAFWGSYASNHIELGDSFFPGMNYMVEIGRKLAREYWNCRGTFIQLTGYPFEVEDDPYGSGGLCRMAYMTGWIANHYWWRYLYTQDKEWLWSKGYPVIRDCALFYTDFLEKGDDGQYHSFPSIQGERVFTGIPEDYTDQPQVVRHARYCLQSAIHASEALDIDEELRIEWQDRINHLVMVDDFQQLSYNEEAQRRYFLNPPEFISYDDGRIPKPEEPPECLVMGKENSSWNGGLGQFPWQLMISIRNGIFNADRDIDALRAHIRRWRLPNGTLRAMSVGDHGFIGAYVESLGIIAPIQEMMLQSWDGVIRIFPAWPKHIDASFRTLRAEGAFLVSASWQNGSAQSVSINSECGKCCRVAFPWLHGTNVLDEKGGAIKTNIETVGVISFETEPGQTYYLRKINSEIGGNYG